MSTDSDHLLLWWQAQIACLHQLLLSHRKNPTVSLLSSVSPFVALSASNSVAQVFSALSSMNVSARPSDYVGALSTCLLALRRSGGTRASLVWFCGSPISMEQRAALLQLASKLKAHLASMLIFCYGELDHAKQSIMLEFSAEAGEKCRVVTVHPGENANPFFSAFVNNDEIDSPRDYPLLPACTDSEGSSDLSSRDSSSSSASPGTSGLRPSPKVPLLPAQLNCRSSVVDLDRVRVVRTARVPLRVMVLKGKDGKPVISVIPVDESKAPPQQLCSMRAGKLFYDEETKMMRADKRKGKLVLSKCADKRLHIEWFRRGKDIPDMEIPLPFGVNAVKFGKLAECPSEAYILSIRTGFHAKNYYFWSQEPASTKGSEHFACVVDSVLKNNKEPLPEITAGMEVPACERERVASMLKHSLGLPDATFEIRESAPSMLELFSILFDEDEIALGRRKHGRDSETSLLFDDSSERRKAFRHYSMADDEDKDSMLTGGSPQSRLKNLLAIHKLFRFVAEAQRENEEDDDIEQFSSPTKRAATSLSMPPARSPLVSPGRSSPSFRTFPSLSLPPSSSRLPSGSSSRSRPSSFLLPKSSASSRRLPPFGEELSLIDLKEEERSLLGKSQPRSASSKWEDWDSSTDESDEEWSGRKHRSSRTVRSGQNHSSLSSSPDRLKRTLFPAATSSSFSSLYSKPFAAPSRVTSASPLRQPSALSSADSDGYDCFYPSSSPPLFHNRGSTPWSKPRDFSSRDRPLQSTSLPSSEYKRRYMQARTRYEQDPMPPISPSSFDDSLLATSPPQFPEEVPPLEPAPSARSIASDPFRLSSVRVDPFETALEDALEPVPEEIEVEMTNMSGKSKSE